MAQKKQVKKVQKKKRWISIIAPKVFREIVIGESPVYDPKEMVGKKLKINLMTLIRDPKKQNINITFLINGVKGDSVVTEIHGYEMTHSSLKRMVKRRREKIDDSFVCKTKDDKIISIKPLIIPNGKINRSVATAIRNTARYNVAKILQTKVFDELISELMSGRFQVKLKEEIKKVYPPRVIEIRKVNVEGKNKRPIKPEDYQAKKKVVKKKVKKIQPQAA